MATKKTAKKGSKKKTTAKKGRTIAKGKKIKVSSKPSSRRGVKAGNVEKLSSNLNIVLGEKEINAILKHVVGTKGQGASDIFRGGTVAINGGGCCVDASVGSSVIGPVSSVGSSVSVTDPTAGTLGSRTSRIERIKATMSGKDVTLTIPGNLKVR